MQRDLTAQASQGSFHADRENDILSTALGNKEHPGRTRGFRVNVPWSHGFVDDYCTYRTRKRSKAEHGNQLVQMITNQFQVEMAALRSQMDILMSQRSQAAPANSGGSPPRRRSSVASAHNCEHDDVRLPIDDIKVTYIYGMHQR